MTTEERLKLIEDTLNKHGEVVGSLTTIGQRFTGGVVAVAACVAIFWGTTVFGIANSLAEKLADKETKEALAQLKDDLSSATKAADDASTAAKALRSLGLPLVVRQHTCVEDSGMADDVNNSSCDVSCQVDEIAISGWCDVIDSAAAPRGTRGIERFGYLADRSNAGSSVLQPERSWHCVSGSNDPIKTVRAGAFCLKAAIVAPQAKQTK
ncbi:MAG: hypothetical protein KBA31_01040 [Alphaproteobacteria bacterium]|nr:hypothetical protein [Alphaproteobacteria bacterium]